MGIIRDAIRQFFPILFLFGCVTFVVYTFFSANIYNGKGVFEGSGSLFAPMLDKEPVKIDGPEYAGGENATIQMPNIKYNAAVQTVGDSASFKALFSVEKADGSYVSGTLEDGFSLYLEDIMDENGNSVLSSLNTEEIAQLEEIPASFIYDKDEDILYFHASGTYTVFLKLYTESGAQAIYELNLPVELN